MGAGAAREKVLLLGSLHSPAWPYLESCTALSFDAVLINCLVMESWHSLLMLAS